MNSDFSPDVAVEVLREVVVTLIRRERPVLSAHQFGVFLTCYMTDNDHTVRGLAFDLNVSKSVITRALDKLTDLGLAVRRPDPNDGRSVLVDRTPGGAGYDEGSVRHRRGLSRRPADDVRGLIPHMKTGWLPNREGQPEARILRRHA